MATPQVTPTKTSTIANSGVSGTAIELEGYEIIGCYVPTLTSSTLTFYVSIGGTTYAVVKDALGNTLLSYAAGTGNFHIDSRDLAALVGYTHVKPVAGTSQGADRSIVFNFKGT